MPEPTYSAPGPLYLQMQSDLRDYLARPDLLSSETACALLLTRWFELPLEEMGPFLDYAASLGHPFPSDAKMRKYVELQLHIEECAAKHLRERGTDAD